MFIAATNPISKKLPMPTYTLKTLALSVALALYISEVSWAEVTLDGSLGASGPLAGPNYAITQDLGRVSGTNLFHSFSAFNLSNTESATFTGSASLTNVVSRVTGGSPSLIAGQLTSTIPGANFYFINPNGITVTGSATLSVDGDLHLSTADYLEFQDGTRFAAADSTPNPVLTSADPSAFGFLNAPHGAIAIQDTDLDARPRATLTVTGGNVEINNSSLSAPGGDIGIAAIQGEGVVQIANGSISEVTTGQGGNVILTDGTFIDVSAETGGSIVLQGGNLVVNDAKVLSTNTDGGDGGDITIVADNLDIGPRGVILTSTAGTGSAGDIHVDVSDTLNISGASPRTPSGTYMALSGIMSGSQDSGTPGNIDINTGGLAITQAGGIFTYNSGTSDGGNITIIADNDVQLINGGYTTPFDYQVDSSIDFDLTAYFMHSSGISAHAGFNSDSGNIAITADNLAIETPMMISTAIRHDEHFDYAGSGNSGNIDINLSGSMSMDGVAAAVLTSAQTNGQSGNITINAESVELENRATIRTSTGIPNLYVYSDGGPVAHIYDEAPAPAMSGIGGNINITANSVTVTDEAFPPWDVYHATYPSRSFFTYISERGSYIASQGTGIYADTYSDGRGGNINITAENLALHGRGAISSSGIPGAHQNVSNGQAGDINIQANSLDISAAGWVQSTAGINLAGIYASAIFSGYSPGNISIQSQQITLRDGGQISARSSYGGNNSASVNIDAGILHMYGAFADPYFDSEYGSSLPYKPSTITTTTTGSQDALDININADSVILSDGASIVTSTTGSGRAGDINIAADSVDLGGFSRVYTEYDYASELDVWITHWTGLYSEAVSGSGAAGQIAINSESLMLHDGAVISTSTEDLSSGDAGLVSLNAGTIVIEDEHTAVKSESYNTGSAGLIAVRGEDLSVTDHASVSTTSHASGLGGNININLGGALNVATDGKILSETHAAGNAGTITAAASDLSVSSGGTISAATTAEGDAGDIHIDATDVRISGGGLITSITSDQGSAGTVDITATNFALTQGGIVSSSTTASGSAGSVNINAEGVSALGAGTGIYSESSGTGEGGRISVTSTTMAVSNQATVSTTAYSTGNAGDIELLIGDALTVSEHGSIVSETHSSGMAGSVAIESQNVSVTSGGRISSSTTADGDAGNIGLDSDNIEVSAGSISSATAGTGAGGTISLDSLTLEIANAGAISSSADATGSAGRVSVRSDVINITGSNSGIHSDTSDAGHAGIVDISANTLALSNLGSITTRAESSGNAGAIHVDVNEVALTSGARISSSTTRDGQGGSIDIVAKRVAMQNSSIDSFAMGDGSAGSIHINADHSVTMDDSAITTSSNQSGGGSIEVNAYDLIHLKNSQVMTNVAGGTGNAGDISIDPRLMILQNSQIFASAVGGDGGNIHIQAGILLMDNWSQIDASSELGIDGNVLIDAHVISIAQGKPLPKDFLTADRMMRSRCAAKSSKGGSLVANSSIQQDINSQLYWSTGQNTVNLDASSCECSAIEAAELAQNSL